MSLTHLFNSKLGGPTELVLRERGVRPHCGDIPQSPRLILERDLGAGHALEHVH